MRWLNAKGCINTDYDVSMHCVIGAWYKVRAENNTHIHCSRCRVSNGRLQNLVCCMCDVGICEVSIMLTWQRNQRVEGGMELNHGLGVPVILQCVPV